MIGVIGLGFVGLTTALGFAFKGYNVYGFDIDSDKRRLLSSGKVPFHEPQLEDILHQHQNKNLFFADHLKTLVDKCQVIFLCVGTPTGSNGESDLSFLKQAVSDILALINRGEPRHLVIKSTVPPLTTATVVRPLIEASGFELGYEIGLTNNPEFLREGYAWEDFIRPDRIVIGEQDELSGKAIQKIYEPFDAPVFRVSLNTAEFIKYLSNTMLANMISFSNEMAMIADNIGGIDVAGAFKLLHLDQRWFGTPAKMTSYIYPGCGFGGYCLPKDNMAMAATAEAQGADPVLLRGALAVNERVKEHFVQKIMSASSPESRVGILGLSFKPGSDDVRDTPAKHIIQKLLSHGYKQIVAYDPIAMDCFRAAYDLEISYSKTLEELVDDCDVIAVVTAWPEFRQARELLLKKTVIDGRYFLK